MGKHAYLIMAHQDIALLNELLACLDDERNGIYLHLDKRSTSRIKRSKGCSCVPTVTKIMTFSCLCETVSCVIFIRFKKCCQGLQPFYKPVSSRPTVPQNGLRSDTPAAR